MAKKKNKITKKRQDSAGSGKERHSNAPRLDAHSRVLSRFYEPLILLYTLGRTRGEHRPASFPAVSNLSNWPIKYLRRMFLQELAYLCDYATGGDSVTAIGMEKKPQRRTFWVATNSCAGTKIVPFLRKLLLQLKTIDGEQPSSTQVGDQILSNCIQFARLRIKAYADFICKRIEESRESLATEIQKDSKCKLFYAAPSSSAKNL